MNKTCCFLFFVAIPIIALSQDSPISKKIDFKLSGCLWMEQHFENNTLVSMPGFIKSMRRNTSKLPTSFDTLTDNPLIHGATYFVIKSSTTYKDKVKLNVDLYSEQRGASYGLFSKDNLLLYPVINIEAKDSFNIANQQLCLSSKIGMVLNEKMDEGLTIYNIDAQVAKLAFEINNWALQATVYGDFQNGVGLNIDDIYALAIKKKTGKKKNTELGVSLNVNKMTGIPFLNSFTMNLFGHKNFSNGKLYAQVGCRPGSPRPSFFRLSNSFVETVAALLGIEHISKINGFTLSNNLELRYYGSIFNEFHNDYALRYRKPAADRFELYNNTVGKYLYPLRKFNTPFSQWAVYTEYYLNSIFSMNLRGSVNKELGKKTAATLTYDINYIHAKDNFYHIPAEPVTVSNFIYPFFKASITYKIIKEVETSLILTNQSMNLDVAYPTHYLLSHPRLGVNLTATF